MIPDNVTSIGDAAFRGCTGLTCMTIGNGVTSIGSSAFRNCYSLTDITYTGTKTQWNGIDKGNGWNDKTGPTSSTAQTATFQNDPLPGCSGMPGNGGAVWKKY